MPGGAKKKRRPSNDQQREEHSLDGTFHCIRGRQGQLLEHEEDYVYTVESGSEEQDAATLSDQDAGSEICALFQPGSLWQQSDSGRSSGSGQSGVSGRGRSRFRLGRRSRTPSADGSPCRVSSSSESSPVPSVKRRRRRTASQSSAGSGPSAAAPQETEDDAEPQQPTGTALIQNNQSERSKTWAATLFSRDQTLKVGLPEMEVLTVPGNADAMCATGCYEVNDRGHVHLHVYLKFNKVVRVGQAKTALMQICPKKDCWIQYLGKVVDNNAYVRYCIKECLLKVDRTTWYNRIRDTFPGTKRFKTPDVENDDETDTLVSQTMQNVVMTSYMKRLLRNKANISREEFYSIVFGSFHSEANHNKSFIYEYYDENCRSSVFYGENMTVVERAVAEASRSDPEQEGRVICGLIEHCMAHATVTFPEMTWGADRHIIPAGLDFNQYKKGIVACMMVMIQFSDPCKHGFTGLWISGDNGMFKTVLGNILGSFDHNRYHSLTTDAPGVGRWDIGKNIKMMLLDDMDTKSFKNPRDRQIFTKLPEGKMATVKVHSRTKDIGPAWFVITSNHRLSTMYTCTRVEIKHRLESQYQKNCPRPRKNETDNFKEDLEEWEREREQSVEMKLTNHDELRSLLGLTRRFIEMHLEKTGKEEEDEYRLDGQRVYVSEEYTKEACLYGLMKATWPLIEAMHELEMTFEIHKTIVKAAYNLCVLHKEKTVDDFKNIM